jgi:hypothetical protein
MRLARLVVLVAFSSVADFHSFLLKCRKHRIIDKLSLDAGEVKMPDGIAYALYDIIDRDIGGALHPV